MLDRQGEERQRALWRFRKQRQRERERLAEGDCERDKSGDINNVTPEVSPSISFDSVTSQMGMTVTSSNIPSILAMPKVARVTLGIVGCAMFIVGLGINAWFSRSLGATELAGWLFLAIGITSDTAAFVLPTLAGALWRQRRVLISIMAWGLWLLTLTYALIASAGFVSVNMADVKTARAERSTAAIELAQRIADTATTARQSECTKRGPRCREREADERRALADLQAERSKVSALADPQTDGVSKLMAWVSLGTLQASADYFAMLRLALMTLLSQIGGLVLMIARRPC